MKGLNAWWARLSTNQKVLVGVGGVAGLYLAYRWYKNRAASQAASTSTTAATGAAATGTTGQATAPSVTLSTPAGSYTGPEGDLSSVLGALGLTGNGTGTGSTTSTTPSTPVVDGPETPATAPASTTPAAGGNGYLPTALGSQQSSIASQAFEGTVEYQGNPYNVYSSSILGQGATGLAAVQNAFDALYPGQAFTTNPFVAGSGGTVAVPVYPQEPTTNIPASAITPNPNYAGPQSSGAQTVTGNQFATV